MSSKSTRETSYYFGKTHTERLNRSQQIQKTGNFMNQKTKAFNSNKTLPLAMASA